MALLHRTLPPIEGQTYFVGDLHGQYSQLMCQLDELGFDQGCDRLICVGDLIDRGPEVIACVNLLNQPWFYATLGNHELLFQRACEDDALRHLHLGNGGEWVEDYDREVITLVRDLITRSMTLTLTIELDVTRRIGVVHSTPLANWADTTSIQDEADMEHVVWHFANATKAKQGRSIAPIEDINAVVCGHLAVEQVVTGGNLLWIDTLAKSGRLSILSADQVLDRVAL